ncbi:uncharacterized protein [Dermacentor albipictus]|uniref:uncharacterized protein isoform X2 n=1 Tax=Dermacentor albipictus TaxID=60249 RepID=UPI0038FD3B4F
MRSLATVFLVGLLCGAFAEDTTESSAPSFQELLDFLNTTEKIWTFLQSSSDKPKGISRTKTYWSSANILRKRKCYSKTWKHLSGDGCHIARWKNNNLHIELF